jgi:hypothetical protein
VRRATLCVLDWHGQDVMRRPLLVLTVVTVWLFGAGCRPSALDPPGEFELELCLMSAFAGRGTNRP